MRRGGDTPGRAVAAPVARRLVVLGIGIAALVIGAGPAGGQAPPADADGPAAGPKVVILEEKMTARFRVDQGAVVLHLPVKVSGAEVPVAGLGAQVLLTGGGVVEATMAPTTEADVIAVDQVVEVAVALPSEKLTGAGGIVSLTRSSGDGRTSLATTKVAFSRQVSTRVGWTIVLAPGLLALVTVAIGAGAIRKAREQRFKDESPKPARATQREEARKYLPRRAKWSFAEGWAGSLTAFGGAAASVLAATGILGDFLPGLAVPPFVAANILFVALCAAAPLVYTAAAEGDGDEAVGTFWGLYGAATLSLWGVFGFLTLLVALVAELEGGPTELPLGLEVACGPIELFFLVLFLVAAVLIGWYAVKTLTTRAALPNPSPASRTVEVAINTQDLGTAIAAAFDAPGRPVAVGEVVQALMAPAGDGGPMTVTVPLTIPAGTGSDGGDAWALF